MSNIGGEEMSKIRLKCDVCGGTFQDQYTKVICTYCERKEIEINNRREQELIGEFIQEKETYLETALKPLKTYPKTTKNDIEYIYHIPEEIINIIIDIHKQLRKKWEEKKGE